MTPDLVRAAADGDLQAVRRLLETGANVDVRGDWDVTPLMEAARLGHTEVVKLLLEHGADPLARDGGDRPSTALLDAIRNRHSGVAREIARRVRDQEERDWGLQYAVLVGDAPTVEAMLDCGADPGATTQKDNRTAFMEAVAARSYDLLELLLRRGADIDQAGSCTPLMLAILLKDPSMTKWLIDAGADLGITDGAGRTALALAEEVGDERLVKLLTARGAKRA